MLLRHIPSPFEMYSPCYELCVESTCGISKDEKTTLMSVKTMQPLLRQIRKTQHVK